MSPPNAPTAGAPGAGSGRAAPWSRRRAQGVRAISWISRARRASLRWARPRSVRAFRGPGRRSGRAPPALGGLRPQRVALGPRAASDRRGAAACSRAAPRAPRAARGRRAPGRSARLARADGFVHQLAAAIAADRRPESSAWKAPLALGVARVEHLPERRLAPIEVGGARRRIGGDPRPLAAQKRSPLERSPRAAGWPPRSRSRTGAAVGRLGARLRTPRALLLQAIDAGAQLAQVFLAGGC